MLIGLGLAMLSPQLISQWIGEKSGEISIGMSEISCGFKLLLGQLIIGIILVYHYFPTVL